MADQTATSAIQETGAHGLDTRTGASHHAAHHGRPSSWAAIAVIVVGFVVGGAAMLTSPQPTWWVFWTGAGIVVVGGIMALSMHIMDDWY